MKQLSQGVVGALGGAFAVVAYNGNNHILAAVLGIATLVVMLAMWWQHRRSRAQP